jgi:hypothetical protein
VYFTEMDDDEDDDDDDGGGSCKHNTVECLLSESQLLLSKLPINRITPTKECIC